MVVNMSSSYDWHWLIKAKPQGSSKLKLGTLRHVRQLGHPIHVQLDQLLLAAEVVVNAVVIHRVKYTEIDWVAYMQVLCFFLSH